MLFSGTQAQNKVDVLFIVHLKENPSQILKSERGFLFFLEGCTLAVTQLGKGESKPLLQIIEKMLLSHLPLGVSC